MDRSHHEACPPARGVRGGGDDPLLGGVGGVPLAQLILVALRSECVCVSACVCVRARVSGKMMKWVLAHVMGSHWRSSYW